MTFNIEEAFDKIWWAYPNDLCKGKKGGKQPALQAFKKVCKSEKDFEHILLNINIQKISDKKNPDAYRWPFVSSYLNQRRFDDLIDPGQEKQIRIEKACVICGNPTHGHNYDKCSHCVHQFHGDKWQEQRKAALITMNLYTVGSKVSQSELAKRCREYLQQTGGYGSLLTQMKSES